jgi:hypothetical protein
MAEKKETNFTVTDKRKFTFDGEVRQEAPVEQETPAEAKSAVETGKTEAAKPAELQPELQGKPADGAVPEEPPPPTAAEQQAQAEAYRKSTGVMDDEIKRQMGGAIPQDFEPSMERFLSSIYMTALLQLGLAHEQGGQPRVDLIGARHTIDTLAMLQQKTKGNLTFAEQSFLDNCLYELRLAYVEVTNALTRAPKPGEGGKGPIPFKK